MMSIRSWLHRRHLKKRYQRGIDALLGGLEDPDPRVRFDAANTLWGLVGELDPGDRARCLPVLQAVAAADPDPTTRANAICALVALDAPSAVATALAALRDPDWSVRGTVAMELGTAEDPRVVDALIPLLEDAEGMVREIAAIQLRRQGDPRALEPLRAMVRRERRDVVAKKAAKQSIKELEARLRPRGA
jgi:HEAT repeat protein